MQLDFHYYATYCAAAIAGYSHEESSKIAYSAQFVDCCSLTVLNKVSGPKAAATTQTQIELADARPDIVTNQNITRIWAPFHFLPSDLYAERKKVSKLYRNKFRLICGPNGDLLKETVELVERIKQKASVDIEMEKQKAFQEAKGELSGIALDIASQILDREVNSEDHTALIEDFIRNVGES